MANATASSLLRATLKSRGGAEPLESPFQSAAAAGFQEEGTEHWTSLDGPPSAESSFEFPSPLRSAVSAVAALLDKPPRSALPSLSSTPLRRSLAGEGQEHPSRWQRAGTAAAAPSDPSLGLSQRASQQLRDLVHPRYIEPPELVQLRAQWAHSPTKNPTWHASTLDRFQKRLVELLEGLDAWERMEDAHARSFRAMIDTAFAHL